MRAAVARLAPKVFFGNVLADAVLLWLVANLPQGGTDSYAVGIGAFLFYGLGILLAIAALLFWRIAWLPFRIALTIGSLVATAFLLVNWIDPWWW